MERKGQDGSGDFVQSLARGLAVIGAFDHDHPRMTLSQVAERTGTARATARRFLLTLVDLRYVESDGKHFWLTPRVLSLGYAYLSTLSLAEIAEPHLVALSSALGQSTSVSVLDDANIVYVARHSVSRIMKANISVGTEFPAHATSMGRVLLAGLNDDEFDAWLRNHELTSLTPRTITNRDTLREAVVVARGKGYALSLEELEPGLSSIAAPITGPRKRVVAAVNISIASNAGPARVLLPDYAPQLMQTAQAISADLVRTRSVPRSTGDTALRAHA